jgi:trans-aconitate 2-methyltransferase
MDWDGASYDRVSTPQARWGRAVLERLELEGDETVVDAGCGTGRVTEELLARLPRGRVVALDASPSMLELAQARLVKAGERVSFVQVDLSELSPADLGGLSPADAVLSTATFHWVTDHDRLAQCGGAGNIASVIEAVRSLGVERAGTWLYASPEETTERLERAGFSDVHAWSHPELATFQSDASLIEFLGTVCLREHLATIPPSERRLFTEHVAAAMPSTVIDYVRLNIVARA